MANWDVKGIPHKGWTLNNVVDVREDNQPKEETVYQTCEMCGNEKIRYVHILSHREVNFEISVV